MKSTALLGQVSPKGVIYFVNDSANLCRQFLQKMDMRYAQGQGWLSSRWEGILTRHGKGFIAAAWEK